MQFYAPLFNKDSILSYLSQDALLILDEPVNIKLAMEELERKIGGPLLTRRDSGRYKAARPVFTTLVLQIVDAFRAEGLAIGLYYSHIDWFHPDAKAFSRSNWDYDPDLMSADKGRDHCRWVIEKLRGLCEKSWPNYLDKISEFESQLPF